MKNHIKITPELEVSIRRCTLEGNKLIMPDPSDTKFDNWPAMKKLFDALGGKWDRKAQVVLFPSDAAALLLPAVMLGGVLDKKKQFQFFPTPPDVAREMIDWLGIGYTTNPYTVLEPSAGTGAIVDVISESIPNAVIHCMEIQPDCRDMLAEKGYTVVAHDFLKQCARPAYDVILMNPPFADGQDIQHVMHAFKFLKPGGRLASIMPSGVMGNDMQRCRDFRATVAKNGGSFHKLMDASFKKSGTGVSTCMVKMFKVSKAVPV